MSPRSSRYSLLDSLGKGGMGEVFLADDAQLGRKVAIKFLTAALEADPKARERLHREARSAAALDHPFICKIHEIVEIDGRTGIVMEHVVGETLQARMRQSRLSVADALAIAGEIAEAIEEAHRRRVIHRDLKPSNIMVTEQGHVKVMDFGLAKLMHTDSHPLEQAETIGPLTDSGMRVGTPAYMAPEQLLGGEADVRSDIFAFGILLYELLAGVHPFTRSSQSETMSAIIREAPVPIRQYAGDLPKSARLMLDRLLAKEPYRRYQSFEDLRVDLRQLAQETSGQTPVPRSVETSEPSGPTRTPYVGRETERAELRRLLEQAKAGRGSLVLIGGEPGVGKTRLTEELIVEARASG
ncbi:MAG: serine/threonine-protein kinase PknK, partial [Acidobacteria bacterium]